MVMDRIDCGSDHMLEDSSTLDCSLVAWFLKGASLRNQRSDSLRASPVRAVVTSHS
jgi:hypothetical protein